MSSDDKEAVQIVTNELRIAHERFKSKLSKHQAFLSLCLTFYSSAEKVFQMIFNRLVGVILYFRCIWRWLDSLGSVLMKMLLQIIHLLKAELLLFSRFSNISFRIYGAIFRVCTG